MRKNHYVQLMLLSLLVLLSCSKNDDMISSENDTLKPSKLKATWSSTDRWGTWSNGGYTLYNNVWGSGYGPQTIWANTYSNWGVWANHPNTGGIKAYPNSEKVVNKKLSALSTLKSSFNATNPSGGAWNCAYDIWCNNTTYEIMLWFNETGTTSGGGNVKPISWTWNADGSAKPVYTNISVGGHTWNVFRGTGGSGECYSFLRTSKTNSGTVDIKAILNWIKNTPKWFGDVTVSKVQHGWEITSSSGGLNFLMNSYSVTFN